MLLTAFVKITFSGYFVQLVITKNKKSNILFYVPTDMSKMYCWVWIYVWTSFYIYTSLWMCFILKLFLYCLEYILYKNAVFHITDFNVYQNKIMYESINSSLPFYPPRALSKHKCPFFNDISQLYANKIVCYDIPVAI